jgi:Na+-transporting NADH:ubiquinone oxidoreductase subunit NqrC
MLSIFGLNKISTVVFIGLVSCTIITGIYWAWKSNIEKQALLEYNSKQLEQSLLEQKQYIEKQKEIDENNRRIADRLLQENEKLSSKINSIDAYLASDEASKQNRPASKIIKNTIDMLRNGEVK